MNSIHNTNHMLYPQSDECEECHRENGTLQLNAVLGMRFERIMCQNKTPETNTCSISYSNIECNLPTCNGRMAYTFDRCVMCRMKIVWEYIIHILYDQNGLFWISMDMVIYIFEMLYAVDAIFLHKKKTTIYSKWHRFHIFMVFSLSFSPSLALYILK